MNQGFLPCTVPHYRAEIFIIFRSYFGRIDDFLDSMQSRSKQRTDERVLVLALKFLALKKQVFPLLYSIEIKPFGLEF